MTKLKIIASCILLASLCSCAGGPSLDLQNSAQYQREFVALGQQATEVHAHIKSDLAGGKTREQIATDAGFAAFNAAIEFLTVIGPPPSGAASRPSR